MKRTVALPEGVLPSHASYSQAVVCGQMLFTSGQGAFDPQTGALVGDDFRTQASRTLENLLLVAAAAGAHAEDAVRIGVHLADLGGFAAFDEVYRQYFHEPYPTRVTVGAPLLAGMLLEVDGVFALPAPLAADGAPAL
ncbi:MAG: Rid family hydrolase [Thermoleophilia bacterium]